MSGQRIQFLAFEGCPLATAARRALESALAECRISGYEEIDILDPAVPEDLPGWGSPTILLNGVDITGAPKGDSVSCRVYPGPDRVPSADLITAGIRRVNGES